MRSALCVQVTCLVEVESLLAERGIEYVKQCIIEEDGIRVTQVGICKIVAICSES